MIWLRFSIEESVFLTSLDGMFAKNVRTVTMKKKTKKKTER